jgi:hypothetical protein
MKRRSDITASARWLPCLIAVVSMFATVPTVRAHQPPPIEGPNGGVAIPAITHGQMLVVARYRAEILDLAARQPRTDPTLRRLAGFVSLQHFACFWGLVPGSLTDESSPFNECAHATTAAARALLAHMVAMPGDQSPARAVEARMEAELASDPASGLLCSNSSEAFFGRIIWPNWQLVPAHLPTVLTFFALVISVIASVLLARWSLRGEPSSHTFHGEAGSGLAP